MWLGTVLHLEVFSPICMVDFFLLEVFPQRFFHKEMWVYLQIEPPAQPCVLFMIAVAVWVFVSLIVVSMFVVGVGTCVKSITYYY